ncbi:MAG TPA: hypothetical protein PL110_16250 [Candidatus Eremiobacteraeota bacterium]|mgnify:FL=1|nr:hypothetical protein [Candidatus Eremiobacteraeota bacterium]
MQEEQPLTEEMVQQILEMRSKARHEEASRLFQAEQRGKEEGRKKANISIVRNMLKLNLPVDTISQATGLSVSEIEKLK